MKNWPLTLSLTGLALLPGSACREVGMCELRTVPGTLATSPGSENEGTREVWSRVGSMVTKYSFPDLKADCQQTFPTTSPPGMYPGHRMVWAIEASSLFYLEPCAVPTAVSLEAFKGYAMDSGIALGDDLLLFYAGKQDSRLGEAKWSLYAYRKERDPTEIFHCEADRRDKDRWPCTISPIPDTFKKPPRILRSDRGGHGLWVVADDFVCRLTLDELRQQPTGEPQCPGRRLESRVTDVSSGSSTWPLWIGTESGAYAWPETSAPLSSPYRTGEVLSIASDPRDPSTAWALSRDESLYRLTLAPGAKAQPIQLKGATGYRRIQAVHDRLVLIGSHGVDECLSCRDAAPKGPLQTRTLARGAYEHVFAAPEGALWLSGAQQSALCLLDSAFPSVPRVVAVAVIVFAGLGIALERLRRHLRRKPTGLLPPEQPAAVPASGRLPLSREELLDRLIKLLPVEFNIAVFRLRMPPEFLRQNARQADQALDVIRYFENDGRLAEVEKVLTQLRRPPA